MEAIDTLKSSIQQPQFFIEILSNEWDLALRKKTELWH